MVRTMEVMSMSSHNGNQSVCTLNPEFFNSNTMLWNKAEKKKEEEEEKAEGGKREEEEEEWQGLSHKWSSDWRVKESGLETRAKSISKSTHYRTLVLDLIQESQCNDFWLKRVYIPKLYV